MKVSLRPTARLSCLPACSAATISYTGTFLSVLVVTDDEGRPTAGTVSAKLRQQAMEVLFEFAELTTSR